MPHYHLSWQVPAERLFDISIRFTAPGDSPRLLLPAWRPGRYLIQNYAANVREWTAGGARVWKDGKTSWRIDARAGDELTFRYRYYAGVLDAGSSFLDDDEAYFNGSNLFMMVEGLREVEHSLTIAAPDDWTIETQLPRRGPNTFYARDYDHLIDSPVIAAAELTRHSFTELEKQIHLIFRYTEGVDTAQLVDPVRAFVRSQAEVFDGELPFDEYRFLYHFGERWHGVEHESSCSIIARRSSLLGASAGDDGVDQLLSISAHELFHAWNVKRIVPAAFSPYDYWNESPTSLLWVLEGLTSYYGDLSLVRSGVWTVQRYLDHLAKEIETLEQLPAREHLSLAQASFDGWLSDPSQMHDHPNAYFSFYNKGELVSALLDLTIRRRTDGAASLDDVMRLLWNEYGRAGRGLEEDGFEHAVDRVAGVGDFFARYVDGTSPLPYADTFAAAGVAFASTSREPGCASLGARLRVSNGKLIADRVIRGTAAMEAGLLPDDELLALNGDRTADVPAFENVLRSLNLGDTAPLLISRAGGTRTLTLTGRSDRSSIVTLRIAGPSELRRGWLGRDDD